MSIPSFDQSTALSIYQSNELFPVDLDEAWQWLGYSRKDSCLDAIEKALIEGVDFSRSSRKSTGGRPKQEIKLSVDGFKSLGMFSQTEQGKAIRKYFLECERIAKSTIAQSQRSIVSNTKLTELTDKQNALRQQIKDMEIALNTKRYELQEVTEALVVEAQAYKSANSEAVRYALLCDDILKRAKQANPYLSLK